MFRTMSFEKYIENATSHLHLEPDWPTIILICDAIRQNDVSPKNALALIKKKMFSSNPHTAMYALIVLESVVKNCGAPIHDEISTKTSCEMFTSLVNTTTHENVRAKMLELIQCWAYAFRSTPKYRAIKDTMNILKTEGRSFPELKEADAMFTSDTAPDWVDGEVCDRCRVAFSFTQRKHHCRNCGQVFCGQCSAKTSTLPKYGIEKEVRVCDGCFDELQKPSSGKPAAAAAAASTDLPAIYLSSTLAQQSQTPARKSEQELKEEEELQLALALSQSEAEEAEKKKVQRSYPKTYSPPRKQPSPVASPPPVVSAAAAEETDPELARYLNRNYWEQQRHVLESPGSPTAPVPSTPLGPALASLKLTDEEVEIEDFSTSMRDQVEIFVNRMKSNSSRGRNISNDSSVQTLFMNLTTHHSKLLTYIKAMDDKRMWYEQLQDKLAQVKDSRAALDVLRQEHQEKLRRQAEEMEQQRQMQMAQKLEIMRKKKQEFLQYQRQMAVHRIQEQEREMKMRQEQQKTQYMMQFSGQPMTYSPQHHQMPPNAMGGYAGPVGPAGYGPQNQGYLPQMGAAGGNGMPMGMMPPGPPHGHQFNPQMPPQQQQHVMPPNQMGPGQSQMMPGGGGGHPGMNMAINTGPGQNMDPAVHQQQLQGGQQNMHQMAMGMPAEGQGHQQQQHQIPVQPPVHLVHNPPPPPVAAPQPTPQQPPQQQQQAVVAQVIAAPAPPVEEPSPAAKTEDLPMAELISFD